MTKIVKGQEFIVSDKITESIFHGSINLGAYSVDCYVLENGKRVISMRGAIKAISGDDTHGNINRFIDNSVVKNAFSHGQNLGNNQCKNEDNILKYNNKTTGIKTIDFNSKNNFGNISKGIDTDSFMRICHAYFDALIDGTVMTEKQRKVAVMCSKLIKGFSVIGLDALIDEATGYQNFRKKTELRDKFSVFISQEIRDWEKTFSDKLWIELGRLTRYKGDPLTKRPSYWGNLVRDLVYIALDRDLYDVLKDKKGNSHSKLHQGLTKELGIRVLQSHIDEIIGMAKVCDNIVELKHIVAEKYSNQPVQTNLKLYLA